MTSPAFIFLIALAPNRDIKLICELPKILTYQCGEPIDRIYSFHG